MVNDRFGKISAGEAGHLEFTAGPFEIQPANAAPNSQLQAALDRFERRARPGPRVSYTAATAKKRRKNRRRNKIARKSRRVNR